MSATALDTGDKGVAVDVRLAILGLEGESYARALGHQFIDLFQSCADLRELHSPCKCEVQVFRKAIVSEVAAFERGAAFEDEQVAELALTQAGQKPSQAIIPLQHGLGNATATMFLVQPVCEKGEIALRDHVCGIASSSSIPILSCRRQRA